MKFLRRRKARRAVLNDVATMPHLEAAALMRACARAGVGKQELMIALSERALATSPPELRGLYTKWRDVYRAGRRVKFAVAPVRDFDGDEDGNFAVTLGAPVDRDLADAVDAVFEGKD